MILFPAIDILEGRAVRLLYGKRENATDYGDPVDCAKRWIDAGAEMLHVVDLTGAFGFNSAFNGVLSEIASLGVPVQSGGGLRTSEDIIRRFAAGAACVVLGTVCVTDPPVFRTAVERYGERIVAGIDAKDGKLAVRGWTEETEKDAFGFGCEAKALGVSRAVFTDVSRDGALSGVNVEATVRMAETGLSIIASGGIRDINDILALKAHGVYGAILGRCLYTGSLSLCEAIEAAK